MKLFLLKYRIMFLQFEEIVKTINKKIKEMQKIFLNNLKAAI